MPFPLAHPHPAVLHRVDDVLFHEAAGNTQAISDLRVGQAIELAQQETVAAGRRQFRQGALDHGQALAVVMAGVGRIVGEAFFGVQHFQRFVLARGVAPAPQDFP